MGARPPRRAPMTTPAPAPGLAPSRPHPTPPRDDALTAAFWNFHSRPRAPNGPGEREGGAERARARESSVTSGGGGGARGGEGEGRRPRPLLRRRRRKRAREGPEGGGGRGAGSVRASQWQRPWPPAGSAADPGGGRTRRPGREGGSGTRTKWPRRLCAPPPLGVARGPRGPRGAHVPASPAWCFGPGVRAGAGGAGAGAGTGPGALPGCPARGCAGRVSQAGARSPQAAGPGPAPCPSPRRGPGSLPAAPTPAPTPTPQVSVGGKKGPRAACSRGGEPGLSGLGAGGPVPFTWGVPGSLIFSDQKHM
uniref:translation initiation factor IF-2-like n=1 Tax=Nyctereutes procyonoides TaxID=34880 RepID=UPI00244443CA|nr:translation initiation factor IF-2-like [Nyctereutes procyonoides]